MSFERHGKARRADRREWILYRRRLGRQIRDARLERDIGIEELAAAIGGHHRTIHEAERGSVNTSMRTLYLIARALDVSLHEVLP